MDFSSKKAFTMIELIFVIVIIGILAAVAIPKLAASRDDAKISSIILNARVTLGDLQAYYTSQGNSNWKSAKVSTATNVPLESSCGNIVDSSIELSPNTFVLCDADVVCLSFETIDEGNLTIAGGTVTTSVVCEAVKSDTAIIAMRNKSYSLGGEIVQR